MPETIGRISSKNLEFIINHVFLPPKLPDKADENVEEKDSALLGVVLGAAKAYQKQLPGPYPRWNSCVRMLFTMGHLQNGKSLAKANLSNAIKNMRAGDVLALYISGQNAGIIMRQLKDQFMMFESFEASPTAAAVIGCEGKLQCIYPGPVVAVRLPEVKDLTFIAEFSSFLEQMNREELEDAMPTASKGGSSHVETRDTAHPKFITEMLTGILRGIGQLVNVERMRKRIADDVVWKDTNLPWRRSPLWLVVRVALQSTLDRSAGNQFYSQYKAFMVFLMAEILDIALEQQLSSDILFVMNTKLSRRAYKMKERMPKFLLIKALDQVNRTAQALETRWMRQNRPAYLNWKPQTLSFQPDTYISLLNGGRYLAAVINRKVTAVMSNGSNANHGARETIESNKIPKRRLVITSGAERYIALADFELWVRECLDGWIAANLQREEACQELSGCITDYTIAGREAYEHNPESMSILLLTTMELWISLDKVAAEKYPLLLDYFPEFPENIFHQLLLPRYHQMKRLHRIETYLHERRTRANTSNPSIFSASVGPQTFAVRYFESSLIHKRLEQTIQVEAEVERQGKIVEFERKAQQYDALVAEARDEECEVRYNRRGDRIHDNWRCQKCSLVRRARAIKIEVHEWPLPEGKQCMTVVFELQCPRGFSVWRDATYRVLVDILSPPQPEKASQPPFEELRSYSGLQKHYINSGQRLNWSSKTKSTRRSHYGGRSFPISVDKVCVKNALQYRLFDTGGTGWARENIECNVQDICTFKLPHGPYQVLQYAVDDTSHTSNQVISNQSECPVELSIHEYMAFGILREGHRLQWLNIARELRTRSLNFSHEAVNMLLMQAAWQVGPSDTLRSSRDCHTVLESLEFGMTLLRELGDMLTSIEANWLEGVSAKTLIYLATRLLSVTGHEDVRSDAFLLLRRARTVTLQWTRQLVIQLQKCEKEKDMKDLQLRALQMAATCRATYDVDHSDLWDVLNLDEDVAILVECAIIVHDNTPAIIDKVPLSTRFLLDRDRRLSHVLEVQLGQLISIRREGLNRSISRVWQGYESEYPWKCLSTPNERWVETKTTAKPDVISQLVRYNLLDGQLLINGLPLARLPNEYISHPTYARLFREKVLDVYPSDMPGMIFQIRHEIHGHQVNFGIQGTELIIRTRYDENEYELVPHTKLVGDFPAHFVEKYFHWLNASTHEIEFRPASDPWIATSKNWHLHYLGKASSMTLGWERMFDIRKTTAAMISSVLSPLEYPQYIDVTFIPDTRTVSAHLPRLKLDFFINGQEELECRQFRGMIVDYDQNIGTLNGLVNRLVMHQKTIRSVIIPHGNLDYEEYEDHVSVKINTEDLETVTYHVYTIDTNLGRLVGNDSLGSHLYKIYLHAVTAHCLPDPLTNRTGTEEALAGLRSAATWSFQKLEKEEIELLTLIASLTPTRVYYPQHLEVMQTVNWGCLSPVVQHDEFHMIVTSIFNHASRFHIFREGSKVVEYYTSKSITHLLARATIRNAAFRRDEFGGSLLTITKDAPYVARHIGYNSIEGTRAWDVAGAARRWSPNLPVCPRLIDVLEDWGEISGDSDGMMFSLGYNRVLLDGNLASFWGLLYNGLCQATEQKNRYQLIFTLATMAYSGRVDLSLVGTFLAFATNPKFLSYDLPIHSSYDLSDEYEPDEDELIEIMEDTAFPFENSAEALLDATYGETPAALENRREETFKYNLKSQAKYFVSYLMSQWPCLKPDTPSKHHTDRNLPLLNIEVAMPRVDRWFESCYKNQEFRDHIEEIQTELDKVSPDTNKVPQTHTPELHEDAPSPSFTTVRLEHLLLRDPPTIPGPPVSSISWAPLHEQFAAPGGENHLKSLLSEFGAAHSDGYGKEYAANMLKSFEALKGQIPTAVSVPSTDALQETREECKYHLVILSQLIQKRLGPSEGVENLMSMAGLWPCISPVSLLQQLATNRTTYLNSQWKQILIAYGEAITMVQRAERLLSYASRDDDFIREAENPGSQGQDQLSYADWLLISIENNFLVRPVQAQIAAKMISPPSNANETLQLNMGEGKSSVIVPIVSAALADGKKLVRVVVLKPLSGQMFRLLVQKLSGLANRRIFFMPFSRSVKLDADKARLVQELYEECMQIGGILLIQPEHILSFKLMGLDQLFGGNQEVATILLDCQRWLETNSRDILDESDEILHVRHELIYTLGQSKSVDFSPTRWTIVQEIFSLIQRHVKSIQERFPQGLEIEAISGSSPSGSFSITRILQRKAGETLFSQVTSDIFAGRLEMVSFRLFPEDIRQLAYKFVTTKGMSEVESRPLLSYCDENDISRSALLLLRGLIAGKILFFALEEKRWRVDYGLDLHRSMLAVPYRAKDCPSLRAEFSHPDVAIALTCLSYYYTGLNDSQLKLCFAILMKSDNPIVEYEAWANEDDNLPETLRQLSGINLIDNHQRKNIIFPRFRHNKSVVDFYLSRVVFPKAAREFPHKLSTSGFDIAESKTHPTTGFSGTNDNQPLLPLSITQHESQEQLNTNAKVLSYLLQPENSYLCAQGTHGERLDVDKLLNALVRQHPPIRVLLDVGAQVLEKRNEEVARDWLKLVPLAQAAVFFSEDDELTVISRDAGSRQPLMVSAFAKRMDECLVYLDEVHTRGTDLKLPTDRRAAVTLGPHLTKDRLVQACMRMRKLGHGHSVIFCAPPEIHQKILISASKPLTALVEVSDVLKWSMLETCTNTRKLVPIWAKQGISYQRRYVAWQNSKDTGQLKLAMLEPEAQTLEERFGLRLSDKQSVFAPGLASEPRHAEMCCIRENCRRFKISSLREADAQEEQERELAHEVEREQHIERPPEATAHEHHIHHDVIEFVRTGQVKKQSLAFVPAFETLSKTSAEKYRQKNTWTNDLLVTKDFASTVYARQGGHMNDFLRPVRWVVSGKGNSLVIMSSHEVNELIPMILRYGSVCVHTYSAKVTKAMRTFEDLSFCPIAPTLGVLVQIPISLVEQLSVFAGQLYLRDYAAYERLCGFLGLYLKEIPEGQTISINSDGFVGNSFVRTALGMGYSPFSKSPVLFLRQLMDCRRKGQTYLATHMGQILHGRLLEEKDFNDEEDEDEDDDDTRGPTGKLANLSIQAR